MFERISIIYSKNVRKNIDKSILNPFWVTFRFRPCGGSKRVENTFIQYFFFLLWKSDQKVFERAIEVPSRVNTALNLILRLVRKNRKIQLLKIFNFLDMQARETNSSSN